MWEEKSTVQRVYEYVVRAGRVVRTREIVAALGESSVSSVTFALTRLVREKNLDRVGFSSYCAPGEAAADDDRDALDPFQDDARLKRIFETIRPVLCFDDLAFLYNIVLAIARIAPDLIKK